MNYTRRDIFKMGLATLPVISLVSAAGLAAEEKPNSIFGGVQIGVIAPYSFHGMPDDAESVLKDLLAVGLSGVEMQHYCAEQFAGAPASPMMRGMFTGGGRRGPSGAGGAAARGTRGPGRAQLTPEQQAAQAEATEKLKGWRMSVSMDKFKELRKLYNDAGVRIYALKLAVGRFPTPMSQEECEYAFNMAEALGANMLQMEFTNDTNVTKQLGDEGAKRKMMVGYHAHLDASPTLWDEAMSQSKYNGINLDIGHYVAAGNTDLLAFIQKNHSRVTSLHLKDRKSKENGGADLPWGEGDTPVKQVLQLMKKGKYGFPGTIEFEYPVPEGSDTLKEITKCVQFCSDTLA